jgi:hypothetical protein
MFCTADAPGATAMLQKATQIAQIRRSQLLRARDMRADANPKDAFILTFPCLKFAASRSASMQSLTEI